jgi:hypothetical protein
MDVVMTVNKDHSHPHHHQYHLHHHYNHHYHLHHHLRNTFIVNSLDAFDNLEA